MNTKKIFLSMAASFALLAHAFLPAGSDISLPTASASGVELTISQSASVSEVPSGEAYSYTLQYSCASTTADCQGVTVESVLPDELSGSSGDVGMIGSPHVTGTNYDQGTRRAVWTFVDPLPAGSTGELTLRAKFPAGSTANGTVASLVSAMNASNATTATSNTVDVTATASNTWVLSKKLKSGGTVDLDTTYEVKVCRVGGSTGQLNLENVTMVDSLPSGTTYVSSSNSGFYEASSHSVTWTVGTVAGTSSCVYRTVVIQYPAASFSLGDTVRNDVQLVGTPVGGSQITLDGYAEHTLKDAAPKIYFSKRSTSSIPVGGTINYYFHSENRGNVPLENVVFTDTIAPELNVTTIRAGDPNLPNGSFPIAIRYQTNQNSEFRDVPGTPFQTGPEKKVNVADMGLSDGEYITKIEWTYASMPTGFKDTGGDASGFLATILATDREGNAVSPGDIIENCSDYSYSYEGELNTGTSCRNRAVAAANRPRPRVDKAIMTSTNVSPGDVIEYRLQLRNAGSADGALSNAVVTDLLDPNLEYLDGSWYMGKAPSDAPEPIFEKVSNHNNTGRTLLKWSWKETSAYELQKRKYIRLHFQVRVKPGTPPGALGNYGWLSGWDNPELHPYSCSFKPDEFDLDLDGDTGETICRSGSKNVEVNTLAAMDSTKFVKGESDNYWKKYPEIGLTTPGGKADYRLIVNNIGNVSMTNLQIVDILPFVGDTGVIDTSGRSSEWRPNLIGPIDAPAGVTVYYSTVGNPCRDELAGTKPTPFPDGCENANWSSLVPDDITTVQSVKFDFGSIVLEPLDAMELTWPMRAPIGAPDQGETAWNSFGYIANRLDTGNPLLPSEPIKVGIATEPIEPPGYGNYVWNDVNADGIQNESASDGINGVRVDLYVDDGDNVPNTSGDQRYSYTITTDDASGNPGYYQFTHFPQGCYFAKFSPPATHSITPKDSGGDDLLDSDVDQSSQLTPIVCLETGYDFSWDMGLIESTTATVGNYVWFDRNQNGLQDESTADGINGVTVKLFPSGESEPSQTTVTANDVNGNTGYYLFSSLDPGNYSICFDLPTDATFSAPNAGDDALDSDADQGSGCSDEFTVNSGDFLTTWDAGMVLPQGNLSLGDRVWGDVDNDGIYEPLENESGINGVKVNLYRDTNADGLFTPDEDEFVATTTTFTKSGEPGYYEFTDLPADGYMVQIDPVNFSSGGVLKGLPSSTGNEPTPDPDDDVDHDDNGVVTSDDGTVTTAITLSVGEEPDGDHNGTVDFGFQQIVGSLGDLVWHDQNENGLQDDGEPGIADVAVKLYDNFNPSVALSTTTTDANGNYRFENLQPGDYFVTFVLSGEYEYTDKDTGSDDADSDADTTTGQSTVVTIDSDNYNPTIDAGFKLYVPPEPEPAICYGPVSTVETEESCVELVFPDTHRVFTIGEQIYLTWTSVGFVDAVKIEYSTDDFDEHAVTLVESTPNTGSYRITIPDDASGNVKFRITDVTGGVDNGCSDTSEVSSIFQPPEEHDLKMEAYTRSLQCLPHGTPQKYFPFGISHYDQDATHTFSLNAGVDREGWDLTIYHDVNGDGALQEDEPQIGITSEMEYKDEFNIIVKAEIEDDSLNYDADNYVLTLTATDLQNPELKSDASYRKYEAENLSTVGKIVDDADASGGKSLYGNIGPVLHHLMFGGYFTDYVYTDRYYATVYCSKVDDNEPIIPVGEIDLWDDHAGQTIAEYFFPGNQYISPNAYQSMHLFFLSPLSGIIEPRVDYYGRVNMWVDKVSFREVRRGGPITYEGELTDKFAGRINTNLDASNDQEVKTVAGESGYISFGPYSTLPNDPDKYYQADFYLKVDDNTVTDQVLKLEVTNYLGDGIVAQADIFPTQFFEPDQYQVFSLSWKGRALDQAQSGYFGSSMEYAVYSTGSSGTIAYLDKIVVQERANQEPVYEAEKMYRNTGILVANEDASNLAVAQTSEAGTLMYGPYSTTEVGQTNTIFQAIYTLAVNDNTITKPVVYIDVFNSGTGERLGGNLLYASQFEENDKLQSFVINFGSPPEGMLEYRVATLGNATVSLDSVEIRKVPEDEIIQAREEDEAFRYEESRLLTQGTAVYDGKASDFQSFQMDQGASGFLSFGPYITDGVNTDTAYKARFRLKSNNNGMKKPIARIDVYNPITDTIEGQKDVYANQFLLPNEYQNFYVNFTSPTEGHLEYRTYLFGEDVQVALDSVTVFKGGESLHASAPVEGADTLQFRYEAEDLYHYAGDIAYDTYASGDRALKASAGQEGFLMFGPYTFDGINTRKNYQAKFFLAVDDNSTDQVVATIDVFNRGRQMSRVDVFANQFAENNVYQSFDLNFASPDAGHLEYRVYTHGATTLYADSLDVYERTSIPVVGGEYLHRYEAEYMFHDVGNNRFDVDASNQQVVIANQAGFQNFGPYTLDISGTGEYYQADFYLKIDDNSGESPVVTLDAFADGKRLGKRRVFANEFDENNVFQGFPLTFPSPESAESQLELRLYHHGNGKTISFDRIDVNITSAPEQSEEYDFRYEAEDLFMTGGTLAFDQNASNLQIVRQNVNESNWVFGPYTDDGVGTQRAYDVKFYLSSDNNSLPEKVALIDVAANGRRLVSREIFAQEFSQTNTLEAFEMTFIAPDTGELEYRLRTYGKSNLVFDHIDVKESSQDISSSSPEGRYQSENMYHLVGDTVFDLNADGKQAVRADEGISGRLNFGPYEEDNVGTGKNHTATFHLQVGDNTKTVPAVTIDVVGATGILDKRTIFPAEFGASNTYEGFVLNFASPADGKLEYRVYAHGETSVTLDYVEVAESSGASSSAPQSGADFAYEAEDMFRNSGQIVFDTNASGKQLAGSAAGQSGHLNFGPYTSDGVGTAKNYEARFALKTNDTSLAEEIVIIDVAVNGQTLGVKKIVGSDFTQSDTLQEFTVPFGSPESGILEYRVYVTGSGEVTFDKVEVFDVS